MTLKTQLPLKLYSDLAFEILLSVVFPDQASRDYLTLSRALDNEIILDYHRKVIFWSDTTNEKKKKDLYISNLNFDIDRKLESNIDSQLKVSLNFLKDFLNEEPAEDILRKYGKSLVDSIVGAPLNVLVVKAKEALIEKYQKDYDQIKMEENRKIVANRLKKNEEKSGPIGFEELKEIDRQPENYEASIKRETDEKLKILAEHYCKEFSSLSNILL